MTKSNSVPEQVVNEWRLGVKSVCDSSPMVWANDWGASISKTIVTDSENIGSDEAHISVVLPWSEDRKSDAWAQMEARRDQVRPQSDRDPGIQIVAWQVFQSADRAILEARNTHLNSQPFAQAVAGITPPGMEPWEFALVRRLGNPIDAQERDEFAKFSTWISDGGLRNLELIAVIVRCAEKIADRWKPGDPD